jgi:hypothetical protein
MPATTTDADSDRGSEAGPPRGWRRAGWFVLIWTGSLLGWLAFAYGLKWVMRQVGIAG